MSVDRERLLDLFSEMVDCYSPSGKEEAVVDLLEEHMKKHGLPVQRQRVADERYNLIVKGSPDADVLFLGHVDTVPAFDIEKYAFSFDGETCSGLGTADMKSGCAAMVEAFCSKALKGELPKSVLLALVVGEEETADGAKALLETHSFSSALVAEPTDLKPAMEHYGYVEVLVRAFGYRRHAAMSDRRTNAIRSMLRGLLALEELVEHGKPAAVLNIRDLISSQAGFAVPDLCSAIVDIHLPPGHDAAAYSKKLELFLQDKLIEGGASRVEVSFPTCAEGFNTDPEVGLARKLRTAAEACGLSWQASPFRSHSDANLLHHAGCATVMYGPGQLAKAHTRDESVSFEQVRQASAVYRHLLDQLA